MYCCPITQELMRDPVIDTEGNSYERAAIVKWLAKSPTSPLTRTRLTVDSLVSNLSLRDLCEAYRAKHFFVNFVTLNNGCTYEGECLRGVPEGKGKMTNLKGWVLEGLFCDGVLTEGTIIYDTSSGIRHRFNSHV